MTYQPEVGKIEKLEKLQLNLPPPEARMPFSSIKAKLMKSLLQKQEPVSALFKSKPSFLKLKLKESTDANDLSDTTSEYSMSWITPAAHNRSLEPKQLFSRNTPKHQKQLPMEIRNPAISSNREKKVGTFPQEAWSMNVPNGIKIPLRIKPRIWSQKACLSKDNSPTKKASSILISSRNRPRFASDLENPASLDRSVQLSKEKSQKKVRFSPKKLVVCYEKTEEECKNMSYQPQERVLKQLRRRPNLFK